MSRITFGLLLLAGAALAAEPTPAERAFRERLDRQLAEVKPDAAVIRVGPPPESWLFLTAELRHYRAGKFWGDSAAAARAASLGPTAAAVRQPDPLPTVRDFAAQCRRAGVVLLVVPVPGKAALYPERLGADWPTELGRPDAVEADWLRTLREAEVEVLDLAPAFAELRRAGSDSHARTDSHWSPAAAQLAARLIAERLRKLAEPASAKALAAALAEPAPVAGPAAKRTPWTATVSGDLSGLLPKADRLSETLTGQRVELAGQPVSSDVQSPIVLIGDSHVLVYHEAIDGGLDIRGSGLPDQLAAELGRAPEVLGVLGSGAVAPRLSLARRRDNLAGKAAVIWCFSVREWTQSPAGWPTVPVVR